MVFGNLRWRILRARLLFVAQSSRLKRYWSVSKIKTGQSSISDNGEYPDFCRRVVNSPEKFSQFRSAPEYTHILEHVPPALGLQYLQTIERNPYVWLRAPYVCKTDVVGGPIQRKFPGLGLASPTTLRYLKVYSDLLRYFGVLSGFSIGEIGVGYGGQCRVIELMDKPKSYSLIDLPEVLDLAVRYLHESGISAGIEVHRSDGTSQLDVDLLLSNYAFSELRRAVQEAYMERVVLKAKRGYFTFNSISPQDYDGMSPEEFSDAVGGMVVKEQPLSFPGNKVVVWVRPGL